MFMSVVIVQSMAAVRLCPEELGMQNQTLTGFRMELHKTTVGSFGSRQLDLAIRFLQPCVFCSHLGFYSHLIELKTDTSTNSVMHMGEGFCDGSCKEYFINYSRIPLLPLLNTLI